MQKTRPFERSQTEGTITLPIGAIHNLEAAIYRGMGFITLTSSQLAQFMADHGDEHTGQAESTGIVNAGIHLNHDLLNALEIVFIAAKNKADEAK